MKLHALLFYTFFKIGLFTIGGGLAMIPLIQRTIVEDRKWMTEEEMVDCVAICQSLPGVIAINAATYIGKKKGGLLGAVSASLGVILPSFVIIILVVLFLGAIGENKYVQGAFTGIKAASCALIMFAAYRLGKQILRGWFAWAIAIISFVIIVFLGVTALWAIVMGALAGIVSMLINNHRNRKAQKTQEKGAGQ